MNPAQIHASTLPASSSGRLLKAAPRRLYRSAAPLAFLAAMEQL
jgi:hypothetical protein